MANSFKPTKPTEHGSASPNGMPLSTVRICDFTGQLAGAGATKWLAAFGAEVIRIEDPVNQGGWDILRNMAPFVDERTGPDLGGGFNNHNVEKRGITLNLRTDRGKEILSEIVKIENAILKKKKERPMKFLEDIKIGPCCCWKVLRPTAVVEHVEIKNCFGEMPP